LLPAATTEKKVNDIDITIAVENGLILEKGVFPNEVDVSTSQGIVTLSGSVDDLLAKKRAVNIAERIRSVRGVIDRITVAPVSRPDEDVRKDGILSGGRFRKGRDRHVDRYGWFSYGKTTGHPDCRACKGGQGSP
jgi:hypothetical protein